MLKKFRDFIKLLDDIEEEERAADTVRIRPRSLAIELPHSTTMAPIIAPPPAMIYVFDRDAGDAGSLADILTNHGAIARTFSETGSFVRGMLTDTPAMVFLGVCDKGDTAIDALVAMGERNYRGGVQLIGGDVSPILDVVRHMGERHALHMLPTIQKPLSSDLVRGALMSLDIAVSEPKTVSLGEALAAESVDFWYQPKIDLQQRQIAGVETFARIRHPDLGIVQPTVFIPRATEGELCTLSRRALTAALAMVRGLSEAGIHLRIAVNMPVRALMSIPVANMVRELGPKHERWPGLLLDVSANQLAANYDLVAAQALQLVDAKVELAIDDFNLHGSRLSLAQLRELPIAEIKLDRALVRGCDADPARAEVCASIVQLARHLGCRAVGIGIERAAEARVLVEMGCDVGQGFLFGEPMPEEDIAGILKKRAIPAGLASKSGRSPPPSPRLKRAVWG